MAKTSKGAAPAPCLDLHHGGAPKADLQWHVRADFFRYLDTANRRLQAIEDDSEISLRAAITAVLQAGVSQAEVALRIGVSRPTLSRWSHGEHIPRPIVRKAYLAEIKAYMNELTENFEQKLRDSSDAAAINGKRQIEGPASGA